MPALTADSLRDRLRAARIEQQAETIHELPIPGYDGQLVVKYRNPDWKERRRVMMHIKGPDVVARELEAAADTLVVSCVGVDAHVDGETVALPYKLDKGLAEYLLDEQVETDRQAVFVVFPSETALMAHLEQLSELQLAADGVIDAQVEGDLSGN